MGRIKVITSGKGGVGKTTTAVNLGACLNVEGRDTLLIDGNLSTPNVGIHLNSAEFPFYLNDVLEKKAGVSDAVYEHASGLKVMPSSLSSGRLEKIMPEKMKEFRKDFQGLSEVVLVDGAAGLGREAVSVMEIADEIIIVTNPEMPAVADALKTIRVARTMKKPVTGVILTRVKRSKPEMHPDSVREMLEVPLLGIIPEHKNFQVALNKRDAVIHTHPKSKPAKAYRETASRIA